jgi:hypothetical protein
VDIGLDLAVQDTQGLAVRRLRLGGCGDVLRHPVQRVVVVGTLGGILEPADEEGVRRAGVGPDQIGVDALDPHHLLGVVCRPVQCSRRRPQRHRADQAEHRGDERPHDGE